MRNCRRLKHHSSYSVRTIFNSEYSIQLPISHRSVNPPPIFQDHPAVSKGHHHKKQMTISCELSSHVYLSRPMTTPRSPLHPPDTACPTAPLGITFFLSSSSTNGGCFPACKSRCADRRGTGVQSTGISHPPRPKGVSWSPLIHY